MDTSLNRSLAMVPRESRLEGFHCILGVHVFCRLQRVNLTHSVNESPVVTLHRVLWERLSYISYCIHIVIANMVIFN